MKTVLEVLWPAFIVILLLILAIPKPGHAADFRQSTKFSPNDYLLHSRDQHQDSIFDNYKPIELGVSIGVGSDCGKINFTSTLQASLKNMLDTKYFGQVAMDTLAGAPMVTICYLSPTLCAVLKHSQISANFLSQMRLNQCALIDKYVDSRVEDYYQERQSCVRKSIDRSGGNLETSMESCSGRGIWEADLSNWAGAKNGEKVSSNRLIDSSAKWAGMDQPESRGTLDLLKSFVGDTVVSKGGITVEYGPRNSPLTPRTYLQSIEKVTYDKLCKGIIQKVEDAGSSRSLDQVVSDSDLKELSPNTDELLVDRQTIRSLSLMSPKQRTMACKKVSDAVSMTIFSADANRSLDVLTTLAQNPNLPPNRKQEIEGKRKALKEQVELTVTLQKQRNDPLNNTLSKINEEGARLQDELTEGTLSEDSNVGRSDHLNANFMDCADGVMCSRNGGGN